MNFRPFSTSPAASKDRFASVSVEHGLNDLQNLDPKRTSKWSTMWLASAERGTLAGAIVGHGSLARCLYSGMSAALRMSEGLVVASSGAYYA